MSEKVIGGMLDEMELKVENKEVDSASFLDLGLQVEDPIFKSNLYDKRKAFIKYKMCFESIDI